MKKKIYLIHHSHTDIGYTHPQETIKLYHRDFINQAIDIFKQKDNLKFRWTCENYWQIENYFDTATEQQKQSLIKLMQEGLIDYSLNYLNMTELIDVNIYATKLKEAKEFSEKYQLDFDTAMSADINGYSEYYVEALAANGIKNNISCVHTHHGAHAFGKKPYIFNWATKSGIVKTVLAPHYHLGNELFMMPNAGTTYLLDGPKYGIDTDNFDLQITRDRVMKYFEDLSSNEEYHYPFVPIMVSGVISDNGMPNPSICKLIEQWNTMFTDIELELVTLDKFFKDLNKLELDLPTHSGDMNDWWADGVGSTPKGTKLFKSAQRKYNLLSDIDPEFCNQDIIKNLVLYAEHTWGHSASISNPYNTLVDEMMLKKQTYAINAHTQMNEELEMYFLNKDKITILPDRDKVYRVINTLSSKQITTATITVEHWELINGMSVERCKNNIIVVDEQNEQYTVQVRQSDRGHDIEFEIELAANESKIFKITNKFNELYAIKNEVCDKVNDHQNKRFKRYSTNKYETKYYSLSIDTVNHTIDIYDKQLQRSVSSTAEFLKLITTTTEAKDQCASRKQMGRNRISGMSLRTVSSQLKFEFLEIGEVYSTIRVYQQHSKMEEVYLDIKMYNNIKKISFNLCYLKGASKEIENIYLNFNVNENQAEVLKLSKGGGKFDPSIDLLPQANNQFFITGEQVTTSNYRILTPDCALATFNNGCYSEIDLDEKVDKSKLCFWLANNFWETNFYTDLSGYHSYRFDLIENRNEKLEDFAFENPLVYATKKKFKEQHV